MANNSKLLYWDANVILSYLNREPTRHKDLSHILVDVQKSGGTKKIISSTLSKIEVSYLKTNMVPDTSQQAIEKIDNFFSDSSVIELVGINEIVTSLARDFIVNLKRQGITLKPADAIHLATAKWVGASVFHTYDDDDFSRVKQFVTFPIEEPSLPQIPLIVMPPHSP